MRRLGVVTGLIVAAMQGYFQHAMSLGLAGEGLVREGRIAGSHGSSVGWGAAKVSAWRSGEEQAAAGPRLEGPESRGASPARYPIDSLL